MTFLLDYRDPQGSLAHQHPCYLFVCPTHRAFQRGEISHSVSSGLSLPPQSQSEAPASKLTVN